MADSKAVLRSKDVAHILDCSPDHVIELARRSEIKGEKQGRFWRFRSRDITAYVRRQNKENAV